VHPDIHQLVQSGPGLRRQFLDRGVFHVEHGFLPEWQRYQRALRQRNAALKGRGPTRAWDTELARHGERLDGLRDDYLSALGPPFKSACRELLDRDDVDLGYRRGWPEGRTLADVLEEGAATDRRQGFTGRGAHRCDFRLTVGGREVRDRVSRGQQKLLLCALQLAQAELQQTRTGSAGLLLIDDLPAELDAAHRARLIDALHALGSQVFVTATDVALLEHALGGDPAPKVFHVEHGRVAEMV
jgi:DNA replication and repair protein RecF